MVGARGRSTRIGRQRLRAGVIAGAFAVLAASVTVHSAASLGGIQGAVAGDFQAIAECDSNGITVTYTTSAGNVATAVLSGLADPGCEGGRAYVSVFNSSGTRITSGGGVTIASDGDTSDNSAAVPLSPNPTAETVASYRLIIVGP